MTSSRAGGGSRCSCCSPECATEPVRPPDMRTYVRALGRSRQSRRTSRAGCPATRARRWSAGSTRPRRSTPVSTRSRAKSALNRVPGEIARSVRVDGQSVPRMLSCVHLLRWGDTPVLMGDGRTLEIRHLRARATGLRHSPARALPALRAHRGPRPLDGAQAGVPRDARGRDRARHERRPPLPDEPRLEARDGCRAGPVQRPHLTLNNKLMGTGAFAEAAARDGRTTSAATSAAWSAATAPRHAPYVAPPGRRGELNRFRLALTRLRGARAGAGLPRASSASRRRASAFAAATRHASRDARDPHRSRGSVAAIREFIALAWAAPRSSGTRASSPGSSTPRARSAAASSGSATPTRRIIDWTTFACRPARPAVRGRERARGHVERPDPRRPRAAAALPPPDRPGDHAASARSRAAPSSRRAG